MSMNLRYGLFALGLLIGSGIAADANHMGVSFALFVGAVAFAGVAVAEFM